MEVWILVGVDAVIVALGVLVLARFQRAPEDPLTAARKAVSQMSRESRRTRKRGGPDGNGLGEIDATSAYCGMDGPL
jgi:hypothetical protein